MFLGESMVPYRLKISPGAWWKFQYIMLYLASNKDFGFLKSTMGNSKHSIVSNKGDFNRGKLTSFPTRKSSHPSVDTTYAGTMSRRIFILIRFNNFYSITRCFFLNYFESPLDVQLGRLRSVDHRLGKVLIQPDNIEDGLFLNNLKAATSFIFMRKCESKFVCN